VAVDEDFAPPVKRFPFPAGAMITGGSGFIVDGGRKIVTNRHVVDGGKEFAVRTGLGEIIKARVLFLSPTDDLAVLELEKPLPADRASSLQRIRQTWGGTQRRRHGLSAVVGTG
jgi:S1-C subfamily serine protease